MTNVAFEQGPIPPACQGDLELANDLFVTDPADCLKMFKLDQPRLNGQVVELFESDDIRGYPPEVRQHLRGGFVVAYNALALAYEATGPVEFPRVSQRAVLAYTIKAASKAACSTELFETKQEIVSGYATDIFASIFKAEVDPQDVCMGSLVFMYGCLEEELLLPPVQKDSNNG